MVSAREECIIIILLLFFTICVVIVIVFINPAVACRANFAAAEYGKP